jgi:voltage-gated potassium channel
MKVEFDRHVYRYLLSLVIIAIAAGTVVFHLVEKLSWLNAYYFSVITLATVGYGDITPKTDLGKFLTTLYIFIGVGIITTFVTYRLRRRAIKVQNRRRK